MTDARHFPARSSPSDERSSDAGRGRGWRRSESTAVRMPADSTAASGSSPRRPSPPTRATLTAGNDWGIYVRNSKKRRNRLGEVVQVSLAIQEQESRTAVAALDPSPRSVTVFRDEGRSGGGGRHRPARDRLRDAVASGTVNAVVAYNAKRIGRNLTESSQLWDHCAQSGAFVTTLDYPDLDNAMVRGAIFGGAEEEYKERQRYSRTAIAYRRRHGLVGTRTGWAYGMRWDGERLERDPAEWPVVVLIFELFDEGWSMGAIARHLTAQGVPRRNSGSTQWDTSAVSRVLRSQWYVGRVPDGRDEHGNRRYWLSPDGPFMDIELHTRAQARVGERAHDGRKYDHPLTGLLFCAACGGWSPLTLAWSRKRRKDGTRLERVRYRCAHRVYDRDFCPQTNSVDAQRVESILLSVLRTEFGCGELAHKRFARRRQIRAELLSVQAAECDRRIAEAEQAQDTLFARRQNGEVLPERIYNREMQRNEQVIAAARAERERHLRQTVLSTRALAALRDELREQAELEPERWFAIAPARRNDYLRLAFPQGVLIYPRREGAPYGDMHGRVGPRTRADARSAHSKRDGLTTRQRRAAYRARRAA
jgi:DNA invertase Pin-like site-specific DNA recombinase